MREGCGPARSALSASTCRRTTSAPNGASASSSAQARSATRPRSPQCCHTSGCASRNRRSSASAWPSPPPARPTSALSRSAGDGPPAGAAPPPSWPCRAAGALRRPATSSPPFAAVLVEPPEQERCPEQEARQASEAVQGHLGGGETRLLGPQGFPAGVPRPPPGLVEAGLGAGGRPVAQVDLPRPPVDP